MFEVRGPTEPRRPDTQKQGCAEVYEIPTSELVRSLTAIASTQRDQEGG